MNKKRVCLIVLDGFGIGPSWGGNALTLARMPNWKDWWRKFPHSSLIAHGKDIGLPGHEIGNSEVGHMTIGAGRVIPQDSTRINEAIRSGIFYKNKEISNAFIYTKNNRNVIHFMGLLSDGGVHASFNHLASLIHMAYEHKIAKVYLQLFSDGRDTAPEQGILLINKLNEIIKNESEKQIDSHTLVEIASITGRYFAMDRDRRMDRTRSTVNCLVYGKGNISNSPKKVFADTYAQGKTDEFVPPTILVDEYREKTGLIKNGDPIIFFNFRSDRARQICHMLLDEVPKCYLVTFIPYGFESDAKIEHEIMVAFPPEPVDDGLTNVLSQNRVSQLHIAETEKYAHVTYFFNSGIEKQYPLEDRLLIPSPNVSTYDHCPQMSAQTITSNLVGAILAKRYEFIIANFANADMVGHTGNLDASIRALEIIDNQLGLIALNTFKSGYYLIITADHGNVEQMVDPISGAIDPEHTRNPVPFIIIPPGGENYYRLISSATLANIAPTILDIMQIPIPDKMTAKSLIIK